MFATFLRARKFRAIARPVAASSTHHNPIKPVKNSDTTGRQVVHDNVKSR
jgi:hypothetical protein